MNAERSEHKPVQFVTVANPTIVYVGIADRGDFDKIAKPCHDHGESDNGHVLTKVVGNYGDDEVTIIFQHWLRIARP